MPRLPCALGEGGAPSWPAFAPLVLPRLPHSTRAHARRAQQPSRPDPAPPRPPRTLTSQILRPECSVSRRYASLAPSCSRISVSMASADWPAMAPRSLERRLAAEAGGGRRGARVGRRARLCLACRPAGRQRKNPAGDSAGAPPLCAALPLQQRRAPVQAAQRGTSPSYGKSRALAPSGLWCHGWGQRKRAQPEPPPGCPLKLSDPSDINNSAASVPHLPAPSNTRSLV